MLTGAALMLLAGCDTSRTDFEHEVERRVTSQPARPAQPPAEPAGEPVDSELVIEPLVPPQVELSALCGSIEDGAEGSRSLASATCRVHLGCKAGADGEAMRACEDHMRAVCEYERPRLEARVASGRLRFDRGALDRCLQALANVGCAPPGEMQVAVGSACDKVLVGRLQRGASCEDAGDCAPGLMCMTPDGSCPGQCLPPRELGSYCNAELEPCGPGLSCEAGRCAAARVALGAACVTTGQCAANAYCLDAEDGGVCGPRRANGKVCDDDDACQSGFCLVSILADELGLETGTCALRLGVGSACQSLVGGCAEGLSCDEATSRCMAHAPDPGGACFEADSPCGVGTGLMCDAGLCELEPLLGDACDPREVNACGFGLCAPTQLADSSTSGELGQCQAFLMPLAACAHDAECGALSCVAGRCDRPTTRCGAMLRDINLGARYRIR